MQITAQQTLRITVKGRTSKCGDDSSSTHVLRATRGADNAVNEYFWNTHCNEEDAVLVTQDRDVSSKCKVEVRMTAVIPPKPGKDHKLWCACDGYI